jgi:hypothetical protein
MDLPSHFAFGLAIGFVFFGHQPEFALLVALGALLPDLDREYWFIPAKRYADEQYHRALFHNVIMIGLTFVVSPFLSLGVFLHVLQDSFTTVKDRGVEWFYPFTRLAKRGRFDADGNPQPTDPNEHVYFYQEDPLGLVEYADVDLQEPLNKPVPWRRVYGFALNSNLLDRGFLFGSFAVLLVWLFVPSSNWTFSNLQLLTNATPSIYETWLVGLIGVGTLFLAGEIDRRDLTHSRLGMLKPVKVPILLLGLVIVGLWAVLYHASIASDIDSAVAQPLQVAAVIILIPLVAILLVKNKTKGGKQATI